MKTDSYTSISRDDVRLRAENAIKRIEKHQSEKDEASIQWQIKKTATAWFFGLVKGRVIDRDEAIEILDKKAAGELWGNWRCYSGNHWKGVAEEIIELCDQSTDQVLLSSSHNSALNVFPNVSLDENND